MKKRIFSISTVALLLSMMFGTVAYAAEDVEEATGTDAVIEVAADAATEDETLAEAEVATEAVEEVAYEEVEETIIEVTTGWYQASNGNWFYYNTSGVKVTGWQKIGGYWYFFNSAGVMQKGWLSNGGYWYYLSSGGKMQTGWQKISGSWYYFSAGGKMQTGWQKISGSWYYFSAGGKMKTGWQQISGSWYYFTSGGKMVNGWQKIGGYWYYFKSGIMQNGADNYGLMLIDGQIYKFNSSGKLYVGWYSEVDDYSGVTVWYYFDAKGLASGWKQVGSTWYYFDPDTREMVTGSRRIDGTLYFFTDSGKYEGKNSPNNTYAYHWSRDVNDYKGGVDFKTLDIYYNGKNQIVIDVLIINNTGRKILYFDNMNISVNYANESDKIASQYFGKKDVSVAPYSVKDVSFTFDKSRIEDLRKGLDSVEFDFSYRYTYY